MAITNIITVLCEGPQDTAFLSKILKFNGYKSNDSKKIGDYPYPYNKVLEKEASEINISDLNIQELRSVMLPSFTLENSDCHLFLYAVGGDSRKDKRQKFLKKLNSFIPKSEDEYQILPDDKKFTVLYFFDADKKGVQARIKQVASEIKIIFNIDDSAFDDNPVSLFDKKLTLGAYIFKEQNKDAGKLEDILLPIMKNGNENIFNKAEEFIDNNFDEERARGKRFDKKKSVIGAAGQLQKSGGSNVVCIGQTDYLTKEKVLANKQCIEIVGFFNQFITG